MSARYTPSLNIVRLRESATIAVSSRARALRAAGRTIMDLGSGEPDFDTPEFIRRAAQQAIDAGATRYTATEGILPLREAIADEANRRTRGLQTVTPGDVVVSTGSKQSLFNACFCLFGPGDEVLIPTPGWTSYYEIVELARATPVPVTGDPDNGMKVSVELLEAAGTPATRGIILNSPCNPTGAVYSRDELAGILALAERQGWWVIGDEIYRHLNYEGAGPAPSLLEVAESRDRLVVVDGVAKAYAMTGWRIGWAIAPHALATSMKALQSHVTSNPAAPSQYAALAALQQEEESREAIAQMLAAFRERRDAALEVFAELQELRVVSPEGAFYLFVDVADAASPDEEDAGTAFARRLLDDHGVAVVPGSAFLTPDWVRMSYAAPFDHVVEGARRLARLYAAGSGAARAAV
jgi:aspartate aminotransferase